MKKYTHRAGAHTISQFLIPWPFAGVPNALQYDVRFDQTARYQHPDGYAGWNKLFGLDCTIFTPGNLGMSYMWAWRWHENAIQLAAYINTPDGKFTAHQVATILPGDTIRLSIFFGNPIRFRAQRPYEDYLQWAHNDGPPSTKISRLIRPWFGGEYPAPHDINIYLKRL